MPHQLATDRGIAD